MSFLSSAVRAAFPVVLTGPWAPVLVPLLIIAATCTTDRAVTVHLR
ncbi:hypothetical protein ABIC99_003876 [Sphaerotilus sulfidivorans]|uniref:Uncharacterized protein n=1 Tax=Sphaerotilus sulfidivorans TaxID=639200 RepID=A0ABV2ISW0_9BURK|nr:hypothetical protein [Sphaerotilus sulfidivorans]NZD47839.1 hypothetical protein [Sphaerotilus sulfidivorans]